MEGPYAVFYADFGDFTNSTDVDCEPSNDGMMYSKAKNVTDQLRLVLAPVINATAILRNITAVDSTQFGAFAKFGQPFFRRANALAWVVRWDTSPKLPTEHSMLCPVHMQLQI